MWVDGVGLDGEMISVYSSVRDIRRLWDYLHALLADLIRWKEEKPFKGFSSFWGECSKKDAPAGRPFLFRVGGA